MSTASRLRRERVTRNTGKGTPDAARRRGWPGSLRIRHDDVARRQRADHLPRADRRGRRRPVRGRRGVSTSGRRTTRSGPPTTRSYTRSTPARSPTTGTGYVIVTPFVTIGGLFRGQRLDRRHGHGPGREAENLRKGRSRVLETDHTLILGWSEGLHDHHRARDRQRERAATRAIVDPRRQRQGRDGGRDPREGARPARHAGRLPHRRPDRPRRPGARQPDDGAVDHRAVARGRRGPRRRGHQDGAGADDATGRRERRPTTSSPRSQDPANLEAADLVGGDEAHVLVDKPT